MQEICKLTSKNINKAHMYIITIQILLSLGRLRI